MNKILFTVFFIFLLGCEDESRIERLALLEKAMKYGPDVKLVLAEKLGAGPVCVSSSGARNYGKGCIKIFILNVGFLEMLCIEFENEEFAINEAKRIKQWQYKNWVFDDVTGEPPLEKFLQEAIGAKSYLELR